MTALTGAEFEDQLVNFKYTAFRLELQPAYREPGEPEALERFLRDDPHPPTELDGLRWWYDNVAAHVGAGRRVGRVRVHDDPPTDYQRWERSIDPWNTGAGESVRYLTRPRAVAIGLLPAAGTRDWWLLDSQRLIVMEFDQLGNRIHNELITDPATVVQACAWRDLAVHYSAPSEAGSDAAEKDTPRELARRMAHPA